MAFVPNAITGLVKSVFSNPSPSPPMLVSCSATELEVSWEPSEGVTQYEVEVSGPIDSDDSDGEQTMGGGMGHAWEKRATTAEHRAIVTSLKPASFYRVRIAGVTSTGRRYLSLPGGGALGFLTADEKRAVSLCDEEVYNALIVSEAVYSENPQVYMRAITRRHNLVMDLELDEDGIVKIFSKADRSVCYVAFKGASTPFYTTRLSEPLKNKIVDLISKGNTFRSVLFVGYDNGGTCAAKTLLWLLREEVRGKKELPFEAACVTFGSPLLRPLDLPDSLPFSHLFYHVIHARDPFVFKPLMPADWGDTFAATVKNLRCTGAHFMDVPAPHLERLCFRWKKDATANRLLLELTARLKSAVRKNRVADPGALLVLGRIRILGTVKGWMESVDDDLLQFLYDIANSADSAAACPVTSDTLDNVAQPKYRRLTPEDFEYHLTATYAKWVCDPKDTDDTAPLAPFVSRSVSLSPRIDEELTYTAVFGHVVEACITGKNLLYTRSVKLFVDGGPSHELEVSRVTMASLVARIPLHKVGLINNHMSLEIEVNTDFGCAFMRDVRCVEHIHLNMIPSWANQFEDMPLHSLFCHALRYSLLKGSRNEWVLDKFHASLAGLEDVAAFLKEHGKQWLKQMAVLPVTEVQTKEVHNTVEEALEAAKNEIRVPPETYRTIMAVLTQAVNVLSKRVSLSLTVHKSEISLWVTFVGKVIAAIGSVALLMTPPGIIFGGAELMVAGTVGLSIGADTMHHVITCQAPYKDKLSFIMKILGVETDRVPNEMYYQELLIHGRLSQFLSKEALTGSIVTFEGEVLKHWDEMFPSESQEEELGEGMQAVDPHWMTFCDTVARKTFARLLWSVNNVVFAIRKAMTEIFIVQIVGMTDAGKTTITNNIFEARFAAKAGSMIQDATQRKSGYRVNYSENLVVVDNAGLVDITAETNLLLGTAGFFLVAIHWDGGLRDMPLVICIAETQASCVPFKLLITKCDTMVLGMGWERETIDTWLDGHLKALNAALQKCAAYLEHGEPADLPDPMLSALETAKTAWQDMHDLTLIGAKDITADDCILACLNTCSKKSVHEMREKECRAQGICMVQDVRNVLEAEWAEIGFDVTFPSTSPQDLPESCDADTADNDPADPAPKKEVVDTDM
ncbi:hypothetical protein DIPPA_02473 [Diplonema papillatum]|nr:hypothetical protein DIPPA_02473 [Diplonema papillatum]